MDDASNSEVEQSREQEEQERNDPASKSNEEGSEEPPKDLETTPKDLEEDSFMPEEDVELSASQQDADDEFVVVSQEEAPLELAEEYPSEVSSNA